MREETGVRKRGIFIAWLKGSAIEPEKSEADWKTRCRTGLLAAVQSRGETVEPRVGYNRLRRAGTELNT